MGSKKLNFSGTITKIPQKQLAPELLSRGTVMLKINVQNAEYAGALAYPYKYLPVMFKKNYKEGNVYGTEGVVIPKGTIVSLLTDQTTIVNGISVPTASGVIPQAIDIDGNLITAPIDDSFFGYDESINALIVPANGGVQSQIPYSEIDDEIGLWNKSTDSNLIIGANIPFGIVVEDVYQDIRGAYLNYQTHDAYSPVSAGFLTIPFVDTDKINFGSANDVVSGTSSCYTAVWRKWAFLMFDSSADGGRSGNLLKSDSYGKFVVESTNVNASKTAQTVGRIIFTDTRFPKDLSATIQNYPGTRLMGVNTAGLPTDLYLFASEVLKAAGQSYDAKSCLAAVQSGAMGYVKIRLSIGK